MISFLSFFFFYFNVGEREIQSPISSKKWTCLVRQIGRHRWWSIWTKVEACDGIIAIPERGLRKKIDLVLIAFYFTVSKLRSTAVSSSCYFRNWVLPYRSIFSISFSCWGIHTWC
jgi:hypothetical protein